MKFLLDEKALDFANSKNIKSLYVNPDLDLKSSCCGIASVDFIISTKEDDTSKYKVVDQNGISIYYNPNLLMYLKEDQELLISAVGILNFKKFIIANEINTIER